MFGFFFSCYPTCVLTNKVVDINTIINYYYNKQKKEKNKTKKKPHKPFISKTKLFITEQF